jgi:hypothetical protein
MLLPFWFVAYIILSRNDSEALYLAGMLEIQETE